MRTRDYRYTLYTAGNGEQLFDLRTDLDEQYNVVANPAYAVERLLEMIVMQDYPKSRRELLALGVH